MYRQNLLPRKVLITTDEVIRMGPVADPVSPKNIESAIIIAEERFVRPLIGDEFYEELRTKKNVLVNAINKSYLEELLNEGNTNEAIWLQEGQLINAIEFVDDEWYQTWWFEYGWKIVAECVVFIATPTNYSKYTSAGQMQENPRAIAITGHGAGSASVELKDIKWTMDKLLMERIDPLIEASKKWLCMNKDHFPKLDIKLCGCSEQDGISLQRKTGFVFGIYDDDDNGCCI